MTTKLKTISQTKRQITVQVPKEKVGQHLQKAYQKVGSKAKLKGFRPGKIPASVLDRYYRHDIDIECLNSLVDETFPKALEEHKIYPLTRPHFDVKPFERDGNYEYSVVIEVKPEIKLKEYKGIKLKKHEMTVAKEDIDKELKAVQESLAQLKPAEGEKKLKKGLVAILDFEGKIDGKPFQGGTAKDYTLSFGQGHFLKDFEEGIDGLEVGKEKDISVTFPKDYFQKTLAEKKATFHVKLKSLNEKELPKIDDELGKDVGKKDLKELTQEIEKMLGKAKQNQIRAEHVEEIRKKFLKDYSDLEVPEGLVNEQLKKSKGKREDIENQLRFEFVLEIIADEEKLQAKQEDMEARLQFYSQVYRKPLPEIRKTFLTPEVLPHVVGGILIDKALDFIIKNAKT